MLALTSLSSFFEPAKAQLHAGYVSVAEPAENIRFVSVEANMLIFELRLNELLPKGSMIRIIDGEDNIIFEERTEADTYSISYKIIRNDMSIINFQVFNKNFSLNQSFKVSSRLEEKIEVTKA